MTDDLLVSRLRSVADRIAATPVQLDDANTVRQAADALDQLRVERDQAAQQERERVKGALLSDEVIAAANAETMQRHHFHPYEEITHTLLNAAFEAALTTLDKETD